MPVHTIDTRIHDVVLDLVNKKVSFKESDFYYCEDITVLDAEPVPGEPVLKLDVSMSGISSPMLCRVKTLKSIDGIDLISDESIKQQYQTLLEQDFANAQRSIPRVSKHFRGIPCQQCNALHPVDAAKLYIVDGKIFVDFTSVSAHTRAVGIEVGDLEVLRDNLYIVPAMGTNPPIWFKVRSMITDHACEDDFIEQLTPGKDDDFRNRLIDLIINLADENNKEAGTPDEELTSLHWRING